VTSFVLFLSARLKHIYKVKERGLKTGLSPRTPLFTPCVKKNNINMLSHLTFRTGLNKPHAPRKPNPVVLLPEPSGSVLRHQPRADIVKENGRLGNHRQTTHKCLVKKLLLRRKYFEAFHINPKSAGESKKSTSPGSLAPPIPPTSGNASSCLIRLVCQSTHHGLHFTNSKPSSSHCDTPPPHTHTHTLSPSPMSFPNLQVPADWIFHLGIKDKKRSGDLRKRTCRDTAVDDLLFYSLPACVCVCVCVV